ncbi:hypothetical protein ZWY2020_059752 [Hordeum vulgare]|nr:hypothetical protein ZWY2020_059752 [Hordeum vulgare]
MRRWRHEAPHPTSGSPPTPPAEDGGPAPTSTLHQARLLPPSAAQDRLTPPRLRRARRQAAAKTNDLAGDGTTTFVILAQGMIAEGVKIVAVGANPVQIARGI